MKTVYLLRHAHSDWPEHISRDVERPLSERGLRDVPKLAERLVERGMAPDLILSSPALRARHTAELIASGLGRDPLTVRFDQQIYLAGSERLLQLLRPLDDALESVMLVAHNPAVTDLSNELCHSDRVDHIPACGLIVLALPVVRWRDIENASARLIHHDFPERHVPST